MDISTAIIAKSDQLNSTDLTGGPRTVTITEVKQGDADQPVKVVTDVFGDKRPFKPSKTVLRILAQAWGLETGEWVGHQMTLFRDPTVRWAGEEIGGIRVKALSHIEKPFSMNLPTSKGKHAKSTIDVLAAPTSSTPTISAEDIQTWVDLLHQSDTLETLQRNWVLATSEKVSSVPQIVAAKNKRKTELGA